MSFNLIAIKRLFLEHLLLPGLGLGNRYAKVEIPCVQRNVPRFNPYLGIQKLTVQEVDRPNQRTRFLDARL